MIEVTLRSVLIADSAVLAMVGQRVYPLILPQGVVYPAMSYQRILTNPVNSLSGASGLDNPHIQVDCWADTYASARSLAEAVRSAVDGAATLKSVLLDSRDMFEDDVSVYRVSMDFSLWERS